MMKKRVIRLMVLIQRLVQSAGIPCRSHGKFLYMLDIYTACIWQHRHTNHGDFHCLKPWNAEKRVL